MIVFLDSVIDLNAFRVFDKYKYKQFSGIVWSKHHSMPMFKYECQEQNNVLRFQFLALYWNFVYSK